VIEDRVVAGRPPISVLIADDHALTRQGLCRMLSRYRDITVVAEATNGQEAVSLYAATRPDVAILDVRMPHLDGFAATRLIRARFPEARIVLITVGGTLDFSDQARGAGALRLLYKDASAAEVARTLRAVRPPRRTCTAPPTHKILEFAEQAVPSRARQLGVA
jgi:DNA-binding NarL/FixJ family response regulator